MGLFACTAGLGVDEMVEEFEKDCNSYNSIMIKAIADRLAEAFAEYLHELVRKEIWGYAAEENFSKEELLRCKYQGIRPAPGYPTQPDHTEMEKLWKMLDVETNTGMTLTESYAMMPAASVSG